MAETDVPVAEIKPKSKLPLLAGLVLGLLVGGGSFFVVYKGMILVPEKKMAEEHKPAKTEDKAKTQFVALSPVFISLGAAGNNQSLRMVAQLEVKPEHSAEVTRLMPRILDVINTYLRAVEVSELQNPSALLKLRAQMLRRVQVVVGKGQVDDLLITEFMIN